ncbi:MAG TPA: M20/M25/M40 family metallo-hydrolase [Rhizomicrobium sp.]|nr:M20/M25/M40 family metallo-hydrolase [Rhizomicrobium sp.]
MAGWRVWRLGLLAVAVWALANYGAVHPIALGIDAPQSQFSAARAQSVLTRLLGAQKPHPAGSAENGAVHARLSGELTRLGVPARMLTGMSCFAGRSTISCATVTDVIAEAIPGEGKAILLVAHLDSVAAGPGASDDASGVATILETIRALKTDPKTVHHPVIALFTDGEESGLLGAALFLRDPGWRARVGVVVNVEARGTSGPSYLFQTSGGDMNLVGLYAQSVALPRASSLYGEIYHYLPNDTDLTPFLNAGFTGYNFAFIGNVAAYHTGLDTIANLDPVSLQSQGDNVLELARGLQSRDFAALSGEDGIYFDVLGRWLPRAPVRLALPLAVIAFFLVFLAGRLSIRPRASPRRRVLALLMPPLLLTGCVAMGFVLAGLAGLISGESDPSFAHPFALRIALSFGCWFVALLAMPWSRSIEASWLWLAGFGIAGAFFAPGISPYFIFPALIAAPLLLWTARWEGQVALALAALAALLVFIGFAANAEAIMGLRAHFLFTIPAALGLIALLPVMEAQNMGRGAWRAALLVSLAVALGAAVLAGLLPAYDTGQPERLNLRYVEKDGQSWWLADPVAHLPKSLRAAADFSEEPQLVEIARGYSAPAGDTLLPVPSSGLSRDKSHVLLDVYGSAAADGMALIVEGGLGAVTIGGAKVDAPQGRVLINCTGRDCARARVMLEFSGPMPGRILLAELRHGLPPKADFLRRARPDWAVPSQGGDVSAAVDDVILPGGF